MKKLTVLIQGNNDLLRQIYEGLLIVRADIITETKLSDVSFLRCDMESCLLALLKERDYPVIVMLEQNTYSQAKLLGAVKDSGADDVYSYASNDAYEVLARIKKCVLNYIAQKA